MGGITFSMLSRWLCCRERFRLYALEGLRAADSFSARMEYGNIWHACEEAFAAKVPTQEGAGIDCALLALKEYARGLCQKYPLQQSEVEKWYEVCKLQFPLYVAHWSNHKEVVNRTPLLQEEVFQVPYTLPSGRVVQLRGKWDGIDLIRTVTKPGTKSTYDHGGIWLFETKTKGDIDEEKMKRQLRFDLQTMLYLVALQRSKEYHDQELGGLVCWAKLGDDCYKIPIQGVRYNVIRRPLSGGKGTIVQHKETKGLKCTKCKGSGKLESKLWAGEDAARCPKCGGAGRTGGKPAESKEEYFSRLADYIKQEPETYFMRWTVTITPGDITKFRRTCLDPLLENMCGWYEYVTTGRNSLASLMPMNWRHPHGVRNILDEGGSTDLDDYLETGSTLGLKRVDKLFGELN